MIIRSQNRDLHPIIRGNTQGNTLVEYALIALLLCVVSIAAVFSVSGAFSQQVGRIKTDILAKESKSQDAAEKALALRDLRGSSPVSGSGLGAGMNGYEAGSNPAMTTGANGNTRGWGSSGNTKGGLAETMSKLSGEEKNLVRDVSNTAYRIARLQQVLEDLSAYSKGDMNKFRNSIVMVDGVRMTTYQVAMALGNSGLASELEEKKKTVLESGIKADVKDQVADISNEVKQDATKTSDVTNDVLTTNTDPTQVQDVTDSEKTNQNAGDLCGLSGGRGNGKDCKN